MEAVAARTENDAPVFVDDSGRRHRRLVWAARAFVALLCTYVALMVVGFVTSLSLPIVHFGGLGELPREAEHRTLGPGSRQIAVPELPPRDGRSNGNDTLTDPHAASGASGAPFPGTAVRTPPNTVVGATVPPPATTPPPTPTTRGTPPPGTTPTTHPHGPPSSVPGKGKGNR